MAPKKPAECKFEDITGHLARYFSPKPSIIVQWIKFNSRYHQQREGIAKFVAELQHIAQYCGYNAMLKDVLCDCLVYGVNDPRIQQRLLVEPDLTFKKAYEIAQVIEIADKDLAATGTGQLPVHSVQKSTSQKIRYHCMGQHNPNSCPFKDSTCHGCGKKRHILKACRTFKSTPPTNANPQNKSSKTCKPWHSLQAEGIINRCSLHIVSHWQSESSTDQCQLIC